MASFEFSWDNAKPATGKVFARKRDRQKAIETTTSEERKLSADKTTSIAIEEKANISTGTQPKNAAVSKQNIRKNRETKLKTLRPEPNTIKTNSMKVRRPGDIFIKRKQKKDRLTAKSQKQEGETTNAPPKPHQNYSLFTNERKDIFINVNTRGASVVEKVFSVDKKFTNLNIHKHIVSNLQKHDFITLTNVQEKSIPVVLEGKNVLIRSQTGSGKTLAYAIPIINFLLTFSPKLQRNDGVQAIIVVPTRELALQTHELFAKINTFQWIVVGHLCGGENRKTEKDRLRKGVHVLIATPGRLLDHILHTSACKIDKVQYLVLDEADRLLDMDFKKDIVQLVEELDKAIVHSQYDPIAMLKITNHSPEERIDETKLENNKSRQTILLSATLSKGIAELADFTMKEHTYIDALDDSPNINPDHMVIPNTVKQEFVMTYVKHRLFTLSSILIAKSKQQNSKMFVFMATSQMVDYHYELFTRLLVQMPKNRGKLKGGGNVVVLDNHYNDDDDDSGDDDDDEIVLGTELFKLHGFMDQNARKSVFAGFRRAKKGILLCTDVAARGIDVPEADCIIQYTGPQSDEDYLHRVGRTGRAGKSGCALIFLTHEEQEYVRRLQEHKIFLKQANSDVFVRHLCDLMEESDMEKAATALQHHYEHGVANDPDLHKSACFAYSSWSRFYNTYPSKMREIFNFKNVNLGHYATSFGLRDSPSNIARMVKGQFSNKIQSKKFNANLSIRTSDETTQMKTKPTIKRKIKSISLTTSEYASGLETAKKKRRKKS